MTDVRMPNGDVIRFPDSMSRDQITSVIQQKFPELSPPASRESTPSYDLATLAEGIKRTYAAGDIEATKKLGAAYRRMQASGPQQGMITIYIQGKPVQVDRSFLSLSPELQNQTVDEIAAQIGVTPSGRGVLANARSLAGSGAGPDPGIGMNMGAGINDVVNTTLGAPVDLSRTLINAATQPNEMVANLPIVGPAFRATQTLSQMANVPPIPDNSVGGRKWIAETLSHAGVRDPDTVNAQTEIEKILRATAAGATYAIAPEALFGLLAKARIVGPQATRIMEQVFGKTQNARQATGNIVAGGLGGAGAQMGTDAAPDNLKPFMSTLGGFVGGGVGTGITALPRIASAAGRMTSDYLAPITQAGRERMVGRQLNEAATSPGAAIATMSAPPMTVPGSKPTAGQLSGDMGLLALERAAQTKDPVPFQQRRAEQNSARLSAIENLQPSGSPEQVVGALRSYLSDIDGQLTQSLDNATARARGSVAALGPGRSPELAGADLRAAYETARADVKARERALWQAVDPNGTLVLPATATRSRAAEVLSGIPSTAKPPSEEEAAIFRAASGVSQNARFSDITALQSRIKAEMRAERFANGESPAYRRLSQLNEAVQQDLEGAITHKVAQEQQAVAAGQMRADDTIAAKLQGEVRAFLDARKAATGEIGGTGAGGVGGSGPASISRSYGAEIPSSRGSGNAPGTPGLPGHAGGVPFDQGALDRLTAARTATRERVETFDNRTLGPIRRRPSATASYDIPDAAVAQRLFYSGPKSFEAIQTFRRAVGDERAIPALTDYAVDRLRTVALGDDGVLNPGRLAAWRRSHADALRALPELDRQLGNVEAATNLMGDAAKARADVLEAAQLGAIGKLIGVTDPHEVTRIIGSIFNRGDAAAQMMRLQSVVGSNAAARAGLRKGVVDYLLDRFVSNAEAATSGLGTIKSDQFQTFVARNAGALRAAGFTDDEVGRLQRIAADLRQSNRSLSAVRIPGQSNTAQDGLAAKGGDDHAATILRVLITAASSGGGYLVGSGLGAVGGGLGAVVAPLATATIQVLRQNGIRRMDDLLKAALLDPEIATALMIKATPGNWRFAQIQLRARFKRALASSVAAAHTNGRSRKQPPSASLPRPAPLADLPSMPAPPSPPLPRPRLAP